MMNAKHSIFVIYISISYDTPSTNYLHQLLK